MKGKFAWLPKSVVEECNNIKKEEDLTKDVEAIVKMGKYSQIGRGVLKENKNRRGLL